MLLFGVSAWRFSYLGISQDDFVGAIEWIQPGGRQPIGSP